MAKISDKKIKNAAKGAGIELNKLFPKKPPDTSGKLSDYQRKKIKSAIKQQNGAIPTATPRKKKSSPSKKLSDLQEKFPNFGYSVVLEPDNRQHFYDAGFECDEKYVYTSDKNFVIDKLYFSEGDCSYYSAHFFAGVAHVQILPLISLPEFLEAQIGIDDEYGQWYDKITLREGDRNPWGMGAGLNTLYDTAEELILFLTQYKRQGALIGEGGSFKNIQVCFLVFGGKFK